LNGIESEKLANTIPQNCLILNGIFYETNF
jgi:hypothetical protein